MLTNHKLNSGHFIVKRSTFELFEVELTRYKVFLRNQAFLAHFSILKTGLTIHKYYFESKNELTES